MEVGKEGPAGLAMRSYRLQGYGKSTSRMMRYAEMKPFAGLQTWSPGSCAHDEILECRPLTDMLQHMVLEIPLSKKCTFYS